MDGLLEGSGNTLKKLSPLEANEMYGFEPAFCLGGKATLENLKKINIFVYLSLLTELQPTEMFNYENYR